MTIQDAVTEITRTLRADAVPPFSVGGVFRDTLRASRRTFLIVAPIGIVVHLMWILPPHLFDVEAEANAWWLATSDTVGGMFTTALVEASLTLVILRGIRNEKSSMGDVVRGLGRSIPVICASIVYFLPSVGLDLVSYWREH